MIHNQTKPKNRKGPLYDRLHEATDKKFTKDVATLVAILAINDRKDEAEQIATSARGEWDDKSFHKAIDEALKGTMPDQDRKSVR